VTTPEDRCTRCRDFRPCTRHNACHTCGIVTGAGIVLTDEVYCTDCGAQEQERAREYARESELRTQARIANMRRSL
jgi:hypothetical protein